MSLIYHPLSRSISARDLSGCLTPNNQIDAKEKILSASKHKDEDKKVEKDLTPDPTHDELISATSSSSTSTSSSAKLLSPPLSPYQRQDSELLPNTEKSFLNTDKPYKVENFKNYELTVTSWSSLTNYKANHFKFLKQYSIMSERQSTASEKYIRKRRYNNNNLAITFNDSSRYNSDSNDDKVRTRRSHRETPTVELELPVRSNSNSPSPKRKKPNSNIVLQQQNLIDENIPDYSPSPDTLPNNNKCLKIDWKGQPMDLRNDPNSSKLHPAEVTLASILRLPCNVYIDSKRRLFYEKVNRLRNGMQFRRTDAQKACRIDVNKASRLFAAFEKVGWLNDEHFEKFL